MKSAALISIISGGKEGDALLRKLYNQVMAEIPKEFVRKYEYKQGAPLTLPLEENSQSFNYVMEAAEKYRLHPTVFQLTHYTQAEIANASYYQMFVPLPLELEGTSAADYGTKYMGGCPNPACRLGKKLFGDVLVDRKFMKKSIGNLRPDLYVSAELKMIISSAGLTGASFEREVRDWKGREMPSYYVMNISNVLPALSESTWLISTEYPDKRYEECGHQVICLRSDMKYEKEKLEGAKDINLSLEYIDNFRLQEIVVSSKVRELFLEHKIKLRFIPVTII